jgi:NAD+ synthase (glutamine-hydrolysing)
MTSSNPQADVRIVMAQQDFLVGAVDANTDKIIAASVRARDELGAHAIVFPELALTGYPPEDLLFREHFIDRVDAAIERLCQAVDGITLVVGYPLRADGRLYNAAAIIRDD